MFVCFLRAYRLGFVFTTLFPTFRALAPPRFTFLRQLQDFVFFHGRPASSRILHGRRIVQDFFDVRLLSSPTARVFALGFGSGTVLGASVRSCFDIVSRLSCTHTLLYGRGACWMVLGLGLVIAIYYFWTGGEA